MKLGGDDLKLRSLASELSIARIQLISSPDDGTDDSEETMRQKMELLSQAAQFNPSNIRVYQVLTAFYEQSKTAEQKAVFREQLEGWIASGQTVPLAHFALGNLLWTESDVERAVFHFEAALELNPSLAMVANNLAWVLSQSETPDLERAEKLVTIAMEADPKNPQYNDTMGAVLFEQERFREALVYFEKILPSANGEKKRELHEKLAAIYENLGQENLAARHRQQAE